MRDIEESEIYKLLFSNAAEGLVVTNEEGEIVLVNPRLLSMFGYQDKSELLNVKIHKLVPMGSKNAHQQHYKTYIKSPESRRMGAGRDLKGARKDGSTFPLEVSLNHFKINGDIYIMGLVTDISERKRIESRIRKFNKELEERVLQRTAALQESQELYSLIASNFPKGTINVLDENLTYVFAEGQGLLKRGLFKEELNGSRYLESFEDKDKPIIQEKLKQVFEDLPVSFEIVIQNKTYRIDGTPLYNQVGQISRILVVENDITEEKQLREDMQRSLDAEKELNELKSRFVSTASHEFRTPLSTIMSSAQLLSKYNEKGGEIAREKTTKHIRRIQDSVKHLTIVLNDFLSLSKLEEGKVQLTIEQFDCPAFFEELVSEMKETAENKHEIKYQHHGEKLLAGEKNSLRNIALNLLSNAIKYSNDGGQVEVETKIDEGEFTLTVTDHGIGIPLEDQKNMFERFFRAKNVINIQGTGLGLNIVKRYTEMLNGTIWFESSPNVGTTFFVNLPIEPSNQ